MEIYDSSRDLRVQVRTMTEDVLDLRVTELEVEDNLGRFTVTADGEPALAALVPSCVVLRKRDGSEVHLDIDWGTLTAAAGQARLVVQNADLTVLEPLRIAV